MGRRVRLLAGITPWFAASALSAALVMAAPLAGAGQVPLALGKVTTRVPRNSESLRNAFRSAVERELESINLSAVKPADRYVLSASLVKMETSADGDRAHATCVVSATLTKQRGGALHAIISGRARVEDAPAEARSAELSAMRAAVHNALARVPEALR
jgi:hypothetical protein